MKNKHQADEFEAEMRLEEEFADAFERGDIPFSSMLTEARRAEIQEMARATMQGQREKIALRVPRNDLVKLKARAMREGIPYQTLINSLIHKYVNE